MTANASFLLLIASLFVIGPAVNAQNLRERKLQQTPLLTEIGTGDILKECEGQCTFDEDCELGLVCYSEEGTVPGCSGFRPTFNGGYCIVAPEGQLVLRGDNGNGNQFPLGECEGDCDNDEECGPGLLCFFRNGNSVRSVPGCLGTGNPGSDYCFKSSSDRPTDAPTTSSPTLTRKPASVPTLAPVSKAPVPLAPTGQPSPPVPTRSPIALEPLTITDNGPLGNCEGSCIDDSDCQLGLVCFALGSDFSVPGCTGAILAFQFAKFCAVAPDGQLVLQGDNGVPESGFLLGECEGDCDNDEDCEPGLLCSFRNGNEPVPGCFGTGSPGKDYCFRSSSARPTRAPTTSSPTLTRKPVSIPTSAPVSEAPVPVVPTRSPIALATFTITDNLPFGNCEGSCNDDSECQNGLVCFQQLGNVPGCTGDRASRAFGFGFTFYCIVAPDGQLVLQGDDGVPESGFLLGECEGDCDDDEDCGPGLLCSFRNGNEPVPGCSGTGSPGKDYCFKSSSARPTRSPSITVSPISPTQDPSTTSPTNPQPSSAPIQVASLKTMASGPFGNCEGSCNDDSECELGLNCFKVNAGFGSNTFVPGCEGFNFNRDNFCVKPPEGVVVIAGVDREPESAFPLGACEGDCGNDDDCKPGLMCISLVSPGKVRGCEGVGKSGVSYCFNPLVLTEPGDNGIPANVYPLGICEGDCDNDGQCGEGLVCFERNRFDTVPGCSGVGVFSKDYCIPSGTAVLAEPQGTSPAPPPPPASFGIFSTLLSPPDGTFSVPPPPAGFYSAEPEYFSFNSPPASTTVQSSPFSLFLPGN